MSFPITAQRRSTTSMYRWQQLTNGSKPTTCYPTKIATRPIQNICFFTSTRRLRRSDTGNTASGNFIATAGRKWSLTHQDRQHRRTELERFLGSPQRACSGRATSVTTDGEDARTAVETSKTATYAGTRKCAGWAQAQA